MSQQQHWSAHAVMTIAPCKNGNALQVTSVDVVMYVYVITSEFDSINRSSDRVEDFCIEAVIVDDFEAALQRVADVLTDSVDQEHYFPMNRFYQVEDTGGYGYKKRLYWLDEWVSNKGVATYTIERWLPGAPQRDARWVVDFDGWLKNTIAEAGWSAETLNTRWKTFEGNTEVVRSCMVHVGRRYYDFFVGNVTHLSEAERRQWVAAHGCKGEIASGYAGSESE